MRVLRWLSTLFLVPLGIYAGTTIGLGYLIVDSWDDEDNIVMDNALLPAEVWAGPAEEQMAEWNELDTTDNSHPFLVSLEPEFEFDFDDGDNTIGFLDEAGLNDEYGLSYANAVAWTVCDVDFPSGDYEECDVMLDPSLPWRLGPDDDEWFQSTVLHELGHVRGLGHYDAFLAMMNAGQSKYLRGETLYMDDKEGVRVYATHVRERDVAIYNKWHDGTAPQWMSMSPTTLRSGQMITLNNFTIENRGTEAFGPLRFGVYLSSDPTITTSDQRLNTGFFDSLGRFTFGTLNWSATIPAIPDCSTRYIGGIVDDNRVYAERYEENNATVFTNGVPFRRTRFGSSRFVPTPINVLLPEDAFEQNDTFASAASISLPFNRRDLTIDSDFENDYYRFAVEERSRVTITAYFLASRGNLDLELLDSSGALLASSSTGGNSESIVSYVPAGAYVVRAFGSGVGSCNSYSLNVSSLPVLPDLTIASLIAPPSAFPGQTIQVTNTVRNVGIASAGPFRVGFYLGPAPPSKCGGPAFVRIGARTLPRLTPKQSSTENTALKIPAETSLGAKGICAIADDLGAVTELNENNNVRAVTIQIVLPPLPEVTEPSVAYILNDDRGGISLKPESRRAHRFPDGAAWRR